MGEAILTGVRPEHLPKFEDAAIASEFAWKMLDDAWTHDMPSKGTPEELEQIHYRRAHMTNGYGLLNQI
jgi:myo-inositol 2-dehydrogenase/D-chiro-inositol 1-dehydrogenase